MACPAAVPPAALLTVKPAGTRQLNLRAIGRGVTAVGGHHCGRKGIAGRQWARCTHRDRQLPH